MNSSLISPSFHCCIRVVFFSFVPLAYSAQTQHLSRIKVEGYDCLVG